MSLSLALTLVAAAGAVQAPSARPPASHQSREGLVESAQVTVRILPPAMLKAGKLAFPDPDRAPHAQVRRGEARTTYEFE